MSFALKSCAEKEQEIDANRLAQVGLSHHAWKAFSRLKGFWASLICFDVGTSIP